MTKKPKSKAREIIASSGHSFHVRIIQLLRNLRWEVLVSPYYNDSFTEKPREIDIIAQKPFPIHEITNEVLEIIYVRLFIECKYITEETIFWFDHRNESEARKKVFSMTRLDPRNFTDSGHHYLSTANVAKLFASEKKRGEESEPIAKAINQVLNGLIYHREDSDLFPQHSGYAHRKTILPYPLVVCNSFDKLFSVSISDAENIIGKIKDPFQLEVNYAYKEAARSRNEFFLIDVIDENHLEGSLEIFKREAGSIGDSILFEYRSGARKARHG